jgi:predicted nucleic acid-binding protein
MRVALDSNIVIYAEGLNDVYRQTVSTQIIELLGRDNLVLPLQAAGEVLVALLKAAGRNKAPAFHRIRYWLDRHIIQETTLPVFDGARGLAERHGFGLWDSIICAAAHSAGASVLLSEDMHNGFRWRGLTIINPFAWDPQDLIDTLRDRRRH